MVSLPPPSAVYLPCSPLPSSYDACQSSACCAEDQSPTFIPAQSHVSRAKLSLSTTVKILCVLTSFRQRAKAIALSKSSRKRPRKRITQDFCQDLETQAYARVDHYLGRTSRYSSKRLVSPKQPVGIDHPREEGSPFEKVDLYLKQVDNVVVSQGRSLTSIAASEAHFLQRRTDLHIKRLSVGELEDLIGLIADLLCVLAEWANASVALGIAYTANLTHLLLCLRHQLLRLFVTTIIDSLRAHLTSLQREVERSCPNWFCEFPNAQHPLSTTWPWSIKPSLAVIWGVCWMFVDPNIFYFSDNWQLWPNMTDVSNPISSYDFYVDDFGLGRTANNTQSYQTQGPAHREYPTMANRPNISPISNAAPPFANSRNHQSSSNRLPHTPSGLADPTLDTSYRAAPAAYAVTDAPGPDIDNWLPEDAIQGQRVDTTFDNTYQGNSWQTANPPGPYSLQTYQPPSQVPAFQAQSPHRQRGATPSIRVTTPDDSQVQHQGSHPPASTLDPLSSLNTSNINLQGRLARNQMSTEISDPPQGVPEPGQFAHINHTGQIHPRAVTPAEETYSRKRSRSLQSQQDHQHHQFRGSGGGSPVSLQEVPPNGMLVDEYRSAPRVPRTHKRSDAPVNDNQKYFCDVSPECAGVTFDRKCEWNKHMDKHDRPYRCQHPTCAKLQGFTYSGGLLRHEREVHGKHGGPKAFLMCPHVECKRHTEKGFTRKENLNEHLRRVHAAKDDSTQLAIDMATGVEVDTPASRLSEGIEVDELSSPVVLGKRRRTNAHDNDTVLIEDVDALKAQLLRLQTENEAKNALIHRLEEEAEEQANRVAALEDMIRQRQPVHA